MAFTASIKINKSADKALHQPAHTSLRALLTGCPYTDGKGLKAALVNIECAAADAYATGGVVCDLLSNLPGWTTIIGVIGFSYYNSNATAAWEKPDFLAQNDSTTSNRKMTLQVVGTGAQVANARVLTGVSIPVLVLGY